MISAKYGKKTVEIPIYDIEPLTNENRIGKSLLPLFAYNILQTYERQYNISKDGKLKAEYLSISSGVLCKCTGFAGITNISTYHIKNSGDMFMRNSIKIKRKEDGKMFFYIIMILLFINLVSFFTILLYKKMH